MGTLTITDPATGKKQKFGYDGAPPTDEELQGLISKAFPSAAPQNPNTVMLKGIDGKMYPADKVAGGSLRYRVPAGGKDPFAVPGSPITGAEGSGAYDRVYDPSTNSTKIVPQATKQPAYFGPAQTGGKPIPTSPAITGHLPTLEDRFDTFRQETVPKGLHRLGKLGELAVEHGFGSTPLTELPDLDAPFNTFTPGEKDSSGAQLSKSGAAFLNAPGDFGQAVEGLPSFALGSAQAAGAGIASLDPKSRKNALPEVQAYTHGLSEAASGGEGGWYNKVKAGNLAGAVDDLETGAALHPVQTVLLIAGLGHGGIKAADVASKVMLKKAARLDAQASATSDPAKIRANAEQADLYREQAGKLNAFVQKVQGTTPVPQEPTRVAPPLRVPGRVAPGVAPPVGIPDTIAGRPTNIQVPVDIPAPRLGANGKPIVRIVKGKMLGPKEPPIPDTNDLPGLLEYSKGAKERLDKSVQDLKDEGRRNAVPMEEYQARVDAGMPPRRGMNAGRIGAGAPTYQVPVELQKSFKIGEAPKAQAQPGEAPTLADTISNDQIMKVKDAPSFRSAVQGAFGLSDAEADHVAIIYDALAKHDEKTRGVSPSDWYQQRFKGMIRGGDSTMRGAGLYQSEDGPFYSQAERVVQANSQKTMRGDQWQGFLNSRGVKPDEMKWTGLGDFLDEKGTGQVTKQEVLDHLAGNKVQLNEITKGQDDDAFKAMNAKADQEISNAYRSRNSLWQSSEDKYGIDDSKWPEDVQQANQQAYDQEQNVRKKWREMARPEPSKYGQYQLPGGTNYREHLLQLPTRDAELRAQKIQEYNDAVAKIRAAGLHINAGDYSFRQRFGQEEGMRLANAVMTSPENVHNIGQNDYLSSHWDEPNVLAHIRTSDRVGPNGEKILHVEEVQSDWHQATKAAKDYDAALKAYQDVNAREVNTREWQMEHDAAHTAFEKAAERYQKVAGGKHPPEAPFSKTWHELAAKKILDMAAREGYDKVTWTPGDEQGRRYSEDAGGPKDQARTAGMKGFYDKILPDTFNKIGKRFGTKVGETDLITKNDGKMVDDGAGGLIREGGNPVKVTTHSLDIPDTMRKTILDEGQPLFQKKGVRTAKGSATLLSNRQAILRGFEKADLSTALHETFHAILPHLSDADLAILEKHFGVGPDGQWSVKAQEGATRAWERYFHDGIAPTHALETVFAKVKAVMQAIYKQVGKGALKADLHPDVKDTFDRILGKYDGETPRAKKEAPTKPGETPKAAGGTTSPKTGKTAPTAKPSPMVKPTDPNADIHGFKMAAIEQVAAKHGITLPDRSEFKEGWKAVEQRALANYAEIKYSLGNADLEKNPNLTNEEVYVGNTRLRQLSEDIIPKLLNSVANAKEADKPRLQAKLDVALAETDRVSNMLYKSGSAAGRRLAYQKAFVSGPFDGPSIMKKAQAAANGSLTREAQTSIIRLVDRGKNLEQKQSAARLDRAQRALEQLQRVTKDITLDDIRGCK